MIMNSTGRTIRETASVTGEGQIVIVDNTDSNGVIFIIPMRQLTNVLSNVHYSTRDG